MKIDLDRIAGILAEVAAEEIVPRFRQLAADDVRHKSPGDMVTVADEAAERVLSRRLTELAPGTAVVGEEAAAADPKVLDRLSQATPVWVIDPVDGTANFAAGMPLFAIMLSLVRDGAARGAWILDPLTGVMAMAEEGGGAWSAGQRLTVAPADEPARMSGAVGYRYGRRPLVRKIAGRSNRVGPTFTLRCAGQEYLALLRAQSHFSIYHRILPWDHAAGQLLHREAGGHSAQLDGSPYRPTVFDGGLLLAPDPDAWQAIHRILVGRPDERV